MCAGERGRLSCPSVFGVECALVRALHALGPLVLKQVDLDAAKDGSTTRVLKFESGAEESEYDVTFRINGDVGTPKDALTVAATKVRHAALWEDSSGGPWEARHGLTATQYQHTFDTLVKDGYRLTNVSATTFDGRDLYAAIWEKSDGPEWIARYRISSAAYQAEFTQLASQGFRALQVCGCSVNGHDLCAATWHKTGGPAWAGRHRMTSESYQQEFDARVHRGWRLFNVSTYTVC